MTRVDSTLIALASTAIHYTDPERAWELAVQVAGHDDEESRAAFLAVARAGQRVSDPSGQLYGTG